MAGNTESEEQIRFVMQSRLAASTRKQYESSISYFKRWLVKNKHNECVNEETDGIVGAALDKHIIQTFLVDQMNRVDEEGNKNGVGIGRLRGFRSAIRFELEEQGVRGAQLEQIVGEEMKQFYGGLKRVDAQNKKQLGEGTEGKEALPFSLYRTLCFQLLKEATKELSLEGKYRKGMHSVFFFPLIVFYYCRSNSRTELIHALLRSAVVEFNVPNQQHGGHPHIPIILGGRGCIGDLLCRDQN